MIFLLLTLLLSSNVTALTPAIPLAVRSPYLSCWLPFSDITYASQTWPTTFNRTQILGWSVLVRIDGLTYPLLGNVAPNLINGTIQPGIEIGPMITVISAQVDQVQLKLTFLNPIEPQDWVKQSIPFSYMSFTAKSLNNTSHSVQVYSDVSGEWVSGDRSQSILWTPTSNSDIAFHSVTLQRQATFKEVSDQAEWGTLYFAMKQVGDSVTYQFSSDAVSRGNFTRNGKLNGNPDPNLVPIADNSAVFAISRDLGTIQATQDPVVWAIGYTTDSAINYTDLSGAPPKPRSPYYKIQYGDSSDDKLIVDFLNDFSDAFSRAQKQGDKILQDAQTVTLLLGDLVTPAIYEVFGSMQLTIGTDAHGKPNNSDIMIFMKNIGGTKANRVNAVETLYAAFPALMYINSSFGGPLLEPLFRLQASHNYSIPFAAADLGSNYPNVSASNSNHSQGVEQTGNMLIMTYAHARASGDGSLISRYYNLLNSWADYLIASTLFIHDQSSADNLTVNNQTNLAIKGIIAIQAMSKMASVVNRTDDVYKYTNAVTNLYGQWKSHALSSDQPEHLLAAYGQTNSWTLGYNLFADKWLGTNLVESSVYDGHSNSIYDLMLNSSSNFSTFGMPVDNFATNVAVSSWSLFVAAMTSNQGLRSELISRVFNRMYNFTIPGALFPVYYDSSNGAPLQGIASPAQGAVFAPLALNVSSKTISIPTNLPQHRTRNKKVGAIVGGTIGGISAIFAVVGVVTFMQRQHRRKQKRNGPRSISSFSTDSIQAGQRMIVTPFDPNSPEDTQDTGFTTEQQRLTAEEPGAETVALRRLSSSPHNLLPISRPVTSVPVGLSDKELARLRAELLSLTSQQPDNPRGSTSNASQSTFSPTPVAETGGAVLPHDTRRLYSEVESLWREMERLRAEGLVVAAPPSYTEGNG